MIDELLRQRIESIATTAVLLVASDYDGVLSPIVDDPAAAIPDALALDALVRIGKLPDTHALAISGRSRAVLLRLMDEPDGIAVIGTHGAEGIDYSVAPDVATAVEGLYDDLLALALQYPGAEVERKPIGAAFHYRNAQHGSQAATQARQIAELAGARTISGKMVVECLFGTADKGLALTAIRRSYEATAVVFLGDDVTDEDAFATLGPDDLGIKVGRGETKASHRVDSQEDVAAVLQTLEAARQRRNN